jgi:hypothetical protein
MKSAPSLIIFLKPGNIVAFALAHREPWKFTEDLGGSRISLRFSVEEQVPRKGATAQRAAFLIYFAFSLREIFFLS